MIIPTTILGLVTVFLSCVTSEKLLSSEYLQKASIAEMFMHLTKAAWGGGPTAYIDHSSGAIRIQENY